MLKVPYHSPGSEWVAYRARRDYLARRRPSISIERIEANAQVEVIYSGRAYKRYDTAHQAAHVLHVTVRDVLLAIYGIKRIDGIVKVRFYGGM